jgi:hypothetical protein
MLRRFNRQQWGYKPYDERILPDKQMAAIERNAGMIASLIAYIKLATVK